MTFQLAFRACKEGFNGDKWRELNDLLLSAARREGHEANPGMGFRDGRVGQSRRRRRIQRKLG